MRRQSEVCSVRLHECIPWFGGKFVLQCFRTVCLPGMSKSGVVAACSDDCLVVPFLVITASRIIERTCKRAQLFAQLFA
jgi:hypothetical protein